MATMKILFTIIIRDLRRAQILSTRRSGLLSILSISSQRNVEGQSKTLLLIVLLYMLSWVPYTVICVFYNNEKPVSQTAEFISIFLVISSTTSSPVVFCLLEKQFWNIIWPLLCPFRRCKTVELGLKQSMFGLYRVDIDRKYNRYLAQEMA